MTHIAVDMDDVTIDFVGGLLAAVHEEFGITIDRSAITEWDLKPILDPIIGRSWWNWLRAREWLWADFPPIPGAIGGIERLRADGHYLELVTSKPAWAEHNVWKWLGRTRPPFQRVTIVAKHDRKVDFTDAIILIDDKPENCIEFLEEGRLAVLFSSLQNRHRTIPNDLPRANNWIEAYDLITRMMETPT